MRRPKHLRDLRLLDDEPFVTQFPRIRDATLQQTRTSRSTKTTFKSVATPFILEKLRSNPDAAVAWLKLAFVAADWDEGCVQPSIDDDDALLLFAEYYYHYFRSGKYVARQFLFEARKQRGFGGYISDAYDASDEDEGDQNDEVLRAKQIEDDDATAAHALDLNTVAKQATLSDSSTLLSAESVQSIDTVPNTIADGNKKRKAENERPSSDSSSHVMNGPSETRITGLADFDSSLSELTESSEEPSPLTSIPKAIVSKPNPQHQSVSAPIARAKPKKPKKQAHTLPAETPSRILPSRQASNRQNLSAMMEKETRYQQEKPLGREMSLEPTTLPVPSRVPEVNSISERKLSKKAKRVKTRKEKRRTNKSIAPALHDESGPIIPPDVIQNAHPIEPPAPPCAGGTSLPKPTRSSQLNGRKDKGRLKAKFLQSKDSLAAPPSKKRRGHDGPIMDQPILPERTRASTRTQTLVSKAAASVQLSQSAACPQEPIPPVSGTSESISAPLKTTKGKGPKNSKKRSLATMEGPTQESHPPEPSIALNTEKTRTKAPLPKHRSKKSAKPLPLPPTPSSVADVDSVLRSAGAEGSAYLAASNSQGNKGSTEWEGVHTPAAQIPDESSSEEDVPLRTIIEKRTTVAAETLTTAVVAEPDANNEPTLNVAQDTSKEVTQDIDLSFLQNIPIKYDPIDLPEKPMQALLPRLPPIWAESRQEVCEAFDYFRSYQGGVYFIKDIVKGYLLGGFSASRDVFRHNGKLIISHGGGKAESIHKNHGHSEAFVDSDQKADDKSVRALLTTFALQRPLALIIDDKYAWFPYSLASRNCTYAVLGFYRIVNAWAERQYSNSANEYVVRYKFAFQWCEEQGEPWWIPQVSDHEVVPEAEPTVLDHPIELATNSEVEPSSPNVTWQCPSCHKSSPQAYAEGWMCLQPSCRLFWKLSGKDQPTTLHYSNSFLQLQQLSAQELPDLRPPPPTDNVPDDGVTTTYHFTRGWHCRECGRLSSRFKWEHWQCKNCGNIHGIQGGRYRSAREFRHQLEAKQFSRHSISPQSGIVKPFTQGYSYGIGHSHYVTFILPKARGYIHLIFSAPAGNAKADKILEDYQREAAEGNLKFRRWPMRAHKCRGTLLTNYFSQNTGEPYQYVGGTDNTVSWDHAPTAVIGARGLIQERMKQALNLDGAFNEVLSAAYMEKQRMAFHSDAEKGLGSIVASLSLGSSAYMHFRLHHQYSSELADPSRRDVLSLFLRHGDVVVMQGADVQTYYEHTVVPLNFRVAATARFINSANHH